MSLGKLLSERKKDKKIESGGGKKDKEGHGFKELEEINSSGAKFKNRILQEAVSE